MISFQQKMETQNTFYRSITFNFKRYSTFTIVCLLRLGRGKSAFILSLLCSL
ncbi:hypothetical protein HMPREF9074_08107 [Capnocytophaga sp. oral taxon 329 str. F0087]|nr:hypothetical protein HMPREF9074_08107 [Capnocytophaga sp. oral taxon 329 str. F0087]